MKKIIVSLFCMLFLQNVYADDLLTHSGLGSGVIDYMDNKLDESAIRALCVKLLQYASAHNIDVALETKNGQSYSPVQSDCKTMSKESVSIILEGTVVYLINAKLENHSQCVQHAMKKAASSQCLRNNDSYIKHYEQAGYVVDDSNDGPIVQCSETDNRCVVNRLMSNSYTHDTGWVYACCILPITECEEENTGTVNKYSYTTGHIQVHHKGFVDKVRVLSDFDYDCRAINQ